MRWTWMGFVIAVAAVAGIAGCSGDSQTADCVAVYSDETLRYHEYTEKECQASCENITFANSCYWDGLVGGTPLARSKPEWTEPMS